MADKILRDTDGKVKVVSKGEEFLIENDDVQIPQPPQPVSSPHPVQATPVQQPQQPAVQVSKKQFLKQARKEWENNPIVKEYDLITMARTTRNILVIFSVLFFVVILLGIVWFNMNLSTLANKDFASVTTVAGDTINVTDADTTTNNFNNTNNIQIYNNNTIIFPKEFVDFMKKVTNETT